ACRTNGAGGRTYFLPQKPTPEQLQAVFADAKIRPTLEVTAGKTDRWLHVLHRVKEGRDIFFVANQNHTGEARNFRLSLSARGYPECWDPMRNEISSLPFQRHEDRVEIAMRMEPNESAIIVFQPSNRSLPQRREGEISGTRSLPVERVAVPSPPAPE